eukprot:3107079-Rhodomonas_salina.2
MVNERKGLGTEEAGWSIRAGLATHSTYTLCMNIRPVGWLKSKPSVLQALKGTQALLALQDVRLPANCVKAVRQSMALLVPQYQMFITTHRQRERYAEGGLQRYWTGVDSCT